LGIEGTKHTENISIIQKADPKNSSNKYITNFKRILTRGTAENIPWEKKIILDHDLIQLESPYFYDFIKKTKKKYILERFYWQGRSVVKYEINIFGRPKQNVCYDPCSPESHQKLIFYKSE
jgi:hypothetical protein